LIALFSLCFGKLALFAIYFQPGAVKNVKLGQAIREALRAPDHSPKAYFGLFPFQWQEGWERSFEALRGDGRPFVAPILQTLILDHALQDVIAWADRVASWEFQQIIPCHFDAPIAANPEQFRQALAVFEQPAADQLLFGSMCQPLPEADVQFLKQLEETLDRQGITSPPKAMG